MMNYKVIQIFTSEEAKYHGKPLHEAIIQFVRGLKIASRCIVIRGAAGSYESGEVATWGIEVLSYHMPEKIEIVLPAAELDSVLPQVERMVIDGIVGVQDLPVVSHRTRQRLIPRQLKVKDVMTAAVRSVTPATPVSEIVSLLLTSSFNAVPVVDETGRPVGIVTQGDLISRAGMPVRLGLLQELKQPHVNDLIASLGQETAGEIMTKPVVCITEDKPLTEAVDKMLDKRLKRLPIVDAEGKLVGMLARVDVFHTITRESPHWETIRGRNVTVSNIRLVSDVMRRDTHIVAPDAPLEEVVQVIDTSDIQRVAVVDEKGRLLGMISDRDLLGAFSDHHAGLWDYLISRLPFDEMAHRHKEFVERSRKMTAADIMKADLFTVREDTPIEDAIRLMAEHGIKRLPVVDQDGIFKGMVSRDSLLRLAV